MKRLLLHIGTAKTGTTSLQAFFGDNAAVLKRQGIAFPLFCNPKPPARHGEYNPNGTTRNGYFLMEAARLTSRPRAHAKKDERRIEKNLDAFAEAVKQNDTLLLSDERLYYEGALSDLFWPELKRLVEAAGIDEIRLLIYLRRQDEFGVSLWKEFCKGSQKSPLQPFLEKEFLDYRGQLAGIESVFGESSLVVRPYDRDLFEGGDIFHDFCNAAGVAWQDDFVLPEVELNPSLSDTAAEIKRWANSVKAYRSASNFLYGPAVNCSAQGAEDAQRRLLTRELFEKLRDSHAENNDYVAQRYLDGNGGKLTCWPSYEGEGWDARSEEALKVTVQILTEAMARQEQLIKRQAKALEEHEAALARQEKTLASSEEARASQEKALQALRKRIARLEAINRNSIAMKVERRLRGKETLERKSKPK